MGTCLVLVEVLSGGGSGKEGEGSDVGEGEVGEGCDTESVGVSDGGDGVRDCGLVEEDVGDGSDTDSVGVMEGEDGVVVGMKGMWLGVYET